MLTNPAILKVAARFARATKCACTQGLQEEDLEISSPECPCKQCVKTVTKVIKDSIKYGVLSSNY